MATKDAGTKTYCMLASFGVFYQASREIETFPQIARPTYLRIWQTPLSPDRVIVAIVNDHNLPAVATIEVAMGCLAVPCRYAFWSERSSSLRPTTT
jgi:hypothetical protein